jgi:hypothetical protein
VIGTVDDKSRALLEGPVCNEPNGAYTPVMACIDAAFDGHLVFPRALIAHGDGYIE